MRKEKADSPDWASRERQGDLEWISENLDVFDFVSKLAYRESGRGAFIIDTTTKPTPDGGRPFAYFSQEQIEEYNDADITGMVQKYDPENEFVLVFLKPEECTDTYRIRPVRQGDDLANIQQP